MTLGRWMALFSALGSTCFLVGPVAGYLQLVGDLVDAITFFVGSILFTAGGALQTWRAWDGWRSADVGGRAAWWSAAVQSAGTLFFNITTYQAMHVALTSSDYDRLVWRPDLAGRSASSSRARSPTALRRAPDGMGGCRRVPVGDGGSRPSPCSAASSSGSPPSRASRSVDRLDARLAATNWNTSFGRRRCFLACALDTLHAGRASKMPLRRELRELEHELERDLRQLA